MQQSCGCLADVMIKVGVSTRLPLDCARRAPEDCICALDAPLHIFIGADVGSWRGPHLKLQVRLLTTGVEAKDVEVAKDILGAILSGHVEGLPGDDADMAEPEAEEQPRGGRR